MKIALEGYNTIMEGLAELHTEGYAYIAYDPAFPLTDVRELNAFDNSYDAVEYCHEMRTDVDFFEYESIWPLYRAMENGLEDSNLSDVQDGMVDLSALLKAYYNIESETIKHKNNMDMNQKNLDYLTDQIKYTGFGEGFADVLKEKIATGDKEFKIDHSAKFGNDTVEATLNFSKSKQSDMYFFNSYNASLQKEGSAEKLEQTFYINRGSNITFKEAYNLMEGRAVHKELQNKAEEKYNSWVQLDFKHSDENGNFRIKKFSENYGYDMEAALSKHPIKELQRDDFKDSLMDSLKKGNVQLVTFQVDGKEQKHYVEANPQFKTVNVYDSDMQRLGSREARAQNQSQGESQDNKKANKAEVKDAEVVGEGANAEKARKTKGQKV
ncbi:hypothetical protein FMM05_19460 [Flavobacterium zepuense]|uniref:Uncharacterized protein n=1 Tax=Flavobacterium zepuense TaxID=2593302 RepID=A0A552UUU8_9FLAO|nr:hypothetical protein [Flavobacterium zepuense]TRW21967.1 hypothetical protein FMM05_19460 [Flavobacterium zepuense]